MYARELMLWLHERLADHGTLEQTFERFEKLRGYNLLPRGREKAGIRLSDEQIANAVLGFAHPLHGFAGHASLILGDLRPVGGTEASFRNEPTLQRVLANLIKNGDENSEVMRVTLSIGRDFKGEEYNATVHLRDNDTARTASFVSKLAERLLATGADKTYDDERLYNMTAAQRAFGSSFFKDLSRASSISRKLDRPFETDWREYESEEEKAEFHRRLGARPSSRFLNLRVDAQVTWPKEPTRTEFGGHFLVLFPRTKEHSHSVSIDLHHEQMTASDARSLISRMLSVMSWCDDRSSAIHEGWSGNTIPVPVHRQDLAFMTMHEWHFHRSLPDSDDLKRCLAYYRDGLNAYSAGLASHAVLSFYRVFESKQKHKKRNEIGSAVIGWVNEVFPSIIDKSLEPELSAFEQDRALAGVDYGRYVHENCRVASAHASRNFPSDPDGADENRRLFNASRIIQRLARYFIKQEFNFSELYLGE